jgi:hypothetical protein
MIHLIQFFFCIKWIIYFTDLNILPIYSMVRLHQAF